MSRKNGINILGKDYHTDREIVNILKSSRNVAVVGISRNPTKPSHYVPKYLIEHEYHVIPVNPFAEEVLGLKCHKSLVQVNEPFEIVDVFRPSEDVPHIVDESIKQNTKVIWLQEGIHNLESERTAIEQGIEVVWNRCIMKEHARLCGGKPRISLSVT